MRNQLNERVAISGVGCTRFGDLLETPEIKGMNLQELTAAAVKEALDDAGLSGQDVDAVFAGNAMVHSSQLPATYSQISKWIGTQLKPGVHFEAQCSTTNVGVAMAAMAIAAGVYDTVLVFGVETTRTKVKDYSPYEREPISHQQSWLWTDMAVNQAYAVPQGYDIFSSYNGLVALGYCRKHGISIEDFDRGMFEVCRTRRLHGSMNPKANVQETLEDAATRKGIGDAFEYWQSENNPFMAWPSRLLSLVTSADGASAIVVTRADLAKSGKSQPVEMKGFGMSATDLPWYGEDPTTWECDQRAVQAAVDMSGISAADIDYLHTHDCSHISSLCTAETIGYLEPGKALDAAREGRLRFDGDKPISTHGGRHAFGHAWAASAGSDTYEAVQQMRGAAGKRQIPKPPEISVIHTHGYAMIGTVIVLGGM
ncbi:acetyl-CoA acyltransferase [Salipiger aestuarii]|uniref:Acetyl-CoA C-acetyltransferase n=1 Tax=Salipiger aestuarii TaxID=568098 RepID=A0A327XG52_9RHOB|nr:thiolase family protein [Salipiger aestuarii]EIE51211.1 Thiolase [Citreicella sp. 357]KAA8604035.1 acetyl-CoA acyltransferase [Salipiger aestuarii]KAA8605893.1 acetyl-CoA acyltransferase [Salipiger aestuarii]KAB2531450.1 acetyl-CoA acyltransferase [Salipiger aestuarii]RAK07444.1 acetyl-CoA C-acetyltransferase [Salipiger aestuarii]